MMLLASVADIVDVDSDGCTDSAGVGTTGRAFCRDLIRWLVPDGKRSEIKILFSTQTEALWVL